MKANELASYLDNALDSDCFASNDPSRNGLQVDGDGRELSRVAFAVDACVETIERAAAAGADMLVVHHGLFWKDIELVVANHRKRLLALLSTGIALYASHLPLDAHSELGNNAALADRLGIQDRQRFGQWKGSLIGWKGSLAEPVSLDKALSLVLSSGELPLHVLPFGPERITSVGVVSGGGAAEMYQAIDEGLDLFVTGEIGHEEYHHALENGISVIAAGHYQTETLGVRRLAAHLGSEIGMDTIFIDVPTGL